MERDSIGLASTLMATSDIYINRSSSNAADVQFVYDTKFLVTFAHLCCWMYLLLYFSQCFKLNHLVWLFVCFICMTDLVFANLILT